MSETKKSVLEAILIPVNQEFDWSKAPETQFEYVNPVVLNNFEIKLANIYSTITQRSITAKKRLADAKDAVTTAEQELEDMELDILDRVPAPSSSKTLKLIDAHIRRAARELAVSDVHETLRAKIRKATTEVAKCALEVEGWKAQLDAVTQASQNIQTHLSYVKNEARNGRAYA